MSYLRALAGMTVTGLGLAFVATGDALTLIGIKLEGEGK